MSAGPELLDAELLERPSGAKKLSRILVNNNRYRYALLAAFVVCVVLSRLGASLVADGDWSYFNPGEAGPFRTAFAGAVLEIAFLPLAFALGGAFALSVFKRPYDARRLSGSDSLFLDAFVLFGLFGLAVWLCVSSWDSQFGDAMDVFRCGVLSCYDAPDDDDHDDEGYSADAYAVNAGMITFVASLLASVFLLALVVEKLLRNRAVLATLFAPGSGAEFARRSSSQRQRRANEDGLETGLEVESPLARGLRNNDDDDDGGSGGGGGGDESKARQPPRKRRRDTKSEQARAQGKQPSTTLWLLKDSAIEASALPRLPPSSTNCAGS